jgi:valyl-tRNA synthetase
MMMGLHFMDEVPFHTVYIHALVRDERGQKMSKSKGNVLDPLDLIDKYGADALRFTLTALAAQGRDIKLSPGRIEGYRNFVTKLWNAARYARMNECTPAHWFDPAKCSLTVNRWIVGTLAESERQMAAALEDYRFNDAANAAYQFTWHTFCDWYLEFTKPLLAGDDVEARAETRAATGWVLDQILHLLHPFMPFVTEELWEALAPDGGRDSLLIGAAWPDLGLELGHAESNAEMNWVVRLISDVRAVRAELNVAAAAQIPLFIKDASDATGERLARHRELILRLARLSEIGETDTVPPGSVQIVVDEATCILPLVGIIDVDAEKERLAKEVHKLDDEIGRIDKKLANDSFVSRAPADVVEENREKRADYVRSRARLSEALERLAVL